MKPPIILFGKYARKGTPGREEYCLIQNNIDIPYLEIDLTQFKLGQLRARFNLWSRYDGLPAVVMLDKKTETCRAYRALIITTPSKKKKIMRLSCKARFPIHRLEVGETTTLGPFLSTPASIRHEWKDFIEYKIRSSNTRRYKLEILPANYEYHPLETGDYYIITRTL